MLAKKPPPHGTGYLLCFRRPDEPDVPAAYKHAGHYLGICIGRPVEARIDEHRRGVGARLTRVIKEAGYTFAVTRTWPNMTHEDERRLKQNRGRLCPVCNSLKKTFGGSNRTPLVKMYAAIRLHQLKGAS